MNSNPPGAVISHSEITNIGTLGFWLLVDDREFFVPFEHYPSFRKATIAQIFHVQSLSPQQFYWPELDIDIELGALEHPDQFPLLFE